MPSDFPASAPAANPVFYRTYSRRQATHRESWQDVVNRNLAGLTELGHFTPTEVDLLRRTQLNQTALPSGRWLWVGGTPWLQHPENFSGAYNCTSTNLEDWEAFALMMDLAMQGSGTGAILEPHFISQLPPISNTLEIVLTAPIGLSTPDERSDTTTLDWTSPNTALLIVGDSRQGWTTSYRHLLELASDPVLPSTITVQVDLGHIRPPGTPLSGFGGIANPIKLPDLYTRVAAILNKARGRQLTSVECCLLIDEAATVVVAGNVRRSAGMRQFASTDSSAASAKDNLWQQAKDGSWRIDPERDALRMANHTRVFHTRPDLDTITESVSKQYFSGEGAIEFAPEAIARSNRDILNTPGLRREFVRIYVDYGPDHARRYLQDRSREPLSDIELDHRLQRYGLNPCGEIIGSNFHCNLGEVHLNLLSPTDTAAQDEAFTAAALTVAALLHHRFSVPRYRLSRELDPIVGVSFTGLFDFFVAAFGTPWLEWWAEGRPDTHLGRVFRDQEAHFLRRWRDLVHETVWAYCDRHGLRRPNRCTTVQPAGTKSLLTGASPGWHPPKAQRFIRRITFAKNDPVALACLDYGYPIVPSQSDKDETGRLLDDPFDPRCTEWLVEIPTEVPWANLPGADAIDISQFSALAQFDFYMQVQRHYTTHNTSATIEFRQDEIQPLAEAIHTTIHSPEGGYISAALLARFDSLETFPRLPFEPISKETYDELQAAVLSRRTEDDFFVLLCKHDVPLQLGETAGPAGCDSDACLLPLKGK